VYIRASAIEITSNTGGRQGRSLRSGGVGGLGMRSKSVRDRHAIIAGVAGNVMKWYDFSVYGYFAANIGRHFFPAQNAVSSLIAAFGVFAAGFLMRPLGSLVFGHIGDKMGRKMALTASVALMAIPTFLIGALPTYQQIGVTASVLLVLMRLLQGLSVGGEYTTSSIFLSNAQLPATAGFSEVLLRWAPAAAFSWDRPSAHW
jgi:MFS transporter, MHS family, proline/betaine transporter